MNKLWFSPESISFQKNEKFKIELTECIEQLQTADVRNGRNHEILQRLQKVIEDHSGISVNIIQKEDDNGIRIGMPMMTKNHVLFDEMRQTVASTTDLVRTLGNDKFIKGFADPSTGRIGGAFSKIMVDLHLPNKDVFTSGLTAGMIAAVILHELGHIWCYYFYFGAVVRTSSVFEYLQRNLTDELDERERIFVITTAGRAAGMPDSDIKAATNIKSKDVVQMVLVSNTADTIRSQLGANIYDHTTWESLADEYAVRMGAGVELATALDMIYRRGLSRSHRGWTLYLFFEVIKLILIAIPGLNFMGVMLILMDASSAHHDDPEARFKRFRDQFVQGLKQPDITPDERKRFLENIDRMNALLAEVEDKRQFLSVIVEAIVPSLRRRKSTLDKIRILEGLATNELFILSQQIKSDLQS